MNQHSYSIKGTAGGADVYLNEQKKEYDKINVRHNTVKLGLWQHFGWTRPDKWHGDNQVLTVGTNSRAWWFGEGAGQYHVYQGPTANSSYYVEKSGYLENFV